MKKALIIGGGFSGCAAAHQLMLQGGWDVTLVERAPFLGAGVRTRYLGGHPYTFGPRHFLTPWTEVYEFLNKYVPLRRCQEHQFLTYVENDSRFYSYPIHVDDIPLMPEVDQINSELSAINISAISALRENDFNDITRKDLRSLNLAKDAKNFEEFWIKSIGETLYEKFVKNYSKKMWQIDDNKIIDDFSWSPKGVTVKEGEKAAWDTAISAYPIAFNGYDDYFRIATEGVNVMLSTQIDNFDIPSKAVWINDEKQTFDLIVNSISPDILFDECYGSLKYVGRDLMKIVLPVEFALPKDVYFIYFAGEENFTRITEYKKFSLHKSDSTLITIEIPSLTSKYYPMPIESEKALAKKYHDEMPDGVFNVGRAGRYLYNVDIDDTIKHSFELMDYLK